MCDEMHAEFEIQPKQNFHYRYPSEMRMTHGVITGQIGDSYPKVTLHLPEYQQTDEFGNKRDFYVLCSLHRYDKKNSNIVLSPHLLQYKKEKKTELNYDFIFEQMKDDPAECPTKRYWELSGYVIIRLPENEHKKSFENKRKLYNERNLPMAFDSLLGNINLNSRKSLTDAAEPNVCLGVTIFERNFYENTYSVIAKPIYSFNIFDGDDLRIHRICNSKGSIAGGTQVTLLIKLGSKLSPQICIKKIHPKTKVTEWKRLVNVNQSDIFANHAITFTMPAYDKTKSNEDNDNDEDEIEVYVNVVIQDSTYKSNSTKFFYLNYNTPSKKRKLMPDDSEPRTHNPRLYDISKDNALTMPQLDRLHIDKNIVRRKIDKIKDKISKEKNVKVEEDNSPIFKALDSMDDIKHLYKLCKKEPEFCKYVTRARNEYRETLLHGACKENNPNFIGPLIGMGCSLNAQDITGRTPLHIAISEKNDQVISTIQNCLQNLTNYPQSVKKSCIKMFSAYDANGFTVLHAAALQGMNELFESLLKFCADNQINILDYGTLDTGDSIGHLVVRNDLKSIMPLLERYVPNFQDVENYAGKTVKDYLLDIQDNRMDDA